MDHRDLARQSRNRKLEYLAQRRKGAKVKKKDSGLGDLARANPRFHELAPFGEFAQTAQTFKYSNTEFAEIGVFLIKNSLLCALGASAVNHPSSSCAPSKIWLGVGLTLHQR